MELQHRGQACSCSASWATQAFFHMNTYRTCSLYRFADACEVMLLSFLGASVRCEWGVPASSESTLTSVVFAGMLLGVYTLGALADGIGRRRGFLASAALLGASGLSSALAPSFAVGDRCSRLVRVPCCAWHGWLVTVHLHREYFGIPDRCLLPAARATRRCCPVVCVRPPPCSGCWRFGWWWAWRWVARPSRSPFLQSTCPQRSAAAGCC